MTGSPFPPGVEAKLLWHDPESHRRSLLVRVAAGATYESHGHPRHEECYVVDGDFSFGDNHLRRGDYHVAFHGGTHPMAHSRGGCLLLINEYSVAA